MSTKKKESAIGITALIFSLGSTLLMFGILIIGGIIMEDYPDLVYSGSSVAITAIALFAIVFLLFIVAIILGIIGLFAKGKNKYPAIAAIVFSFLSIFFIGISCSLND